MQGTTNRIDLKNSARPVGVQVQMQNGQQMNGSRVVMSPQMNQRPKQIVKSPMSHQPQYSHQMGSPQVITQASPQVIRQHSRNRVIQQQQPPNQSHMSNSRVIQQQQQQPSTNYHPQYYQQQSNQYIQQSNQFQQQQSNQYQQQSNQYIVQGNNQINMQQSRSYQQQGTQPQRLSQSKVISQQGTSRTTVIGNGNSRTSVIGNNHHLGSPVRSIVGNHYSPQRTFNQSSMNFNPLSPGNSLATVPKVLTQQQYEQYKMQLSTTQPTTNVNVFQDVKRVENHKLVSDLENEQKVVQNQIDQLLQRSQNISANYQKSIQQSKEQINVSRKQSQMQRNKDQELNHNNTQDLDQDHQIVQDYQQDYYKKNSGDSNRTRSLSSNNQEVLEYQEQFMEQQGRKDTESMDSQNECVQEYYNEHFQEQLEGGQLNESQYGQNHTSLMNHTGTVTVIIVKATDLPSSRLDKTDGYIKVTLNEDTQTTQTINDDTCPQFNKMMKFTIDNVGPNQSLYLVVMDADVVSDDLLAQAELGLRELILHSQGQWVEDQIQLVDTNGQSLNSYVHVQLLFEKQSNQQ